MRRPVRLAERGWFLQLPGHVSRFDSSERRARLVRQWRLLHAEPQHAEENRRRLQAAGGSDGAQQAPPEDFVPTVRKYKYRPWDPKLRAYRSGWVCVSSNEGPASTDPDAREMHTYEFDTPFDGTDTPRPLQIAHGGNSIYAGLFDASFSLCKYLESPACRRGLAAGQVVVELGAGTGVVGLVAAALGARVVLTDLQEGIPLLERNIAQNKDNFAHEPVPLALNWDEAYACSLRKTPLQAVEQLRCAGLWPVDKIILSECTYNTEFAQPLQATIRALSADAPEGHRCEVLLAHAYRGSEWAFHRWFDGALRQVPSAYLRIPSSLDPEILSLWCGDVARSRSEAGQRVGDVSGR